MLGEAGGYAVITCHACQQPVYLTPHSWDFRHVDDSPICQEEATPC